MGYKFPETEQSANHVDSLYAKFTSLKFSELADITSYA